MGVPNRQNADDLACVVCFAHSHCSARCTNEHTTLYGLGGNDMDGEHPTSILATMVALWRNIYLHLPLLLFPFAEAFGAWGKSIYGVSPTFGNMPSTRLHSSIGLTQIGH